MMDTLPTRNRREMQFEHAAKIEGARIIESFETRGGAMHNCMTGCIVKCSNEIHDPDGKYLTSALEFETIALMGSNCAIGDLDAIATMDRLCDELGLDTIEAGGALAVAMDGGKLSFGDAEAAIRVLQGVDKGDEMGTAIGNGLAFTGKKYGVARVPAIKGQAIPAWEPRTLKATGVTYCTSPMGPDHTAGLVTMPAGGSGGGVQGRTGRGCDLRLQRILSLRAALAGRDAAALQPDVWPQHERPRHCRLRLAVPRGRVGIQPARRLHRKG